MDLGRRRLFAIPLFILTMGFFANPALGQDEEYSFDSLLTSYLQSDSILLDELEALLLEDDSLSIIDLVDSLISFDPRYSQISLRLGYNSQILNAGRDLGINQYGFTASLSYYHKTGLFGELSGFWNSEFSPNYNPTITTLGFMDGIGKRFGYILTYEHYFYHGSESDELYVPYTNSLGANTYFDFDFLLPGLNYYFLFGEENVHRLQTYLSGRIRIKKAGFIDQISLLPTASMLIGNQHLIFEQVNYRLLLYGVRQLKRGNITRQQLEEARDLIINQTEETVYGIMNYTISLPVYFYIKNSSFMLNYSYNIPKALPGEFNTLENNSFFSVSFLQSFPFRK